MNLVSLADVISPIECETTQSDSARLPLLDKSSLSNLTSMYSTTGGGKPSASQGRCTYQTALLRCEWSGKLRRGWCPKHYERWRKHGDPSVVVPTGHPFVPPEKRKPRQNCPVVDEETGPCGREVHVHGMCRMHSHRMRRTGDPTKPHRGWRMESPPGECGMLGCYYPARGRGFCRSHYYNFSRAGDPIGGKGNINRSDEDHEKIREYLRLAVTAHEALEMSQAREWATRAIVLAEGKLTRGEKPLVSQGLLLTWERTPEGIAVKNTPARLETLRFLVLQAIAGPSTDAEIERKFGVTRAMVRRTRQQGEGS